MTEEMLKNLRADHEAFMRSELSTYILDAMTANYEAFLTEASDIKDPHGLRKLDKAMQLKEDIEFLKDPLR